MTKHTTKWTTRGTLVPLLLTILIAATALAAAPPDTLHYQGVLRDAAGDPLDTSLDMVFRFWTAETGGDELLLDRHLAANAQAVVVSQGLFGVALGTGEVLDGAGPDSYLSLAEVFRDHGEVWLEVQVEAETLAPRVRVAASAYAHNASHLEGRSAAGFIDTVTDDQTKTGRLRVDTTGLTDSHAISGTGDAAGGVFRNANSVSRAFLAYEDASGGYAFAGEGRSRGGWFAVEGYGTRVILAESDTAIKAWGDNTGGDFYNERPVGQNARANIADHGYGISAIGSDLGGLFENDNLNYLAAGHIDFGMRAAGSGGGGRFQDIDGLGDTIVADQDWGLHASGAYQDFGDGGGGLFEDLTYTGLAYVAHGDTGIYAEGGRAGGEFVDTDSGNYGRVGYNTYKIFGTGAVSFVQNHPKDTGKVIVYHAPEASEVAVYTRGSARLEGGTARVALDETFQWTANPELGLTAHLTARGSLDPLSVEAVSTTELVVRGPEGSEAAFDYLVYGLRIGFEESAPLQPKTDEAFLPAMGEHQAIYASSPELRRFNALERHRSIATRLGREAALEKDAPRAAELVAGIGRYVPAPAVSAEMRDAPSTAPKSGAPSRSSALAVERGNPGGSESRERDGELVEAAATLVAADMTEAEATGTWLPVAEPVEAGDLLAFDPIEPGSIHRARHMGDAVVVGVAIGPSRAHADGGLEAPVAVGRYARIKVDAAYGAIRPGDLLVPSATPGHAMLGSESAEPAVVGRALEGWQVGRGQILVYLALR